MISHYIQDFSVHCNVFVNSNPKNLMYFRLCKKYGLELQFKKSFPELYTEAFSNSEAKGLLFKMMALEVINFC